MISKKKLYLFQTIPFFVVLVLISISTSSYADWQTNLFPGVVIQDGSSDLDVGTWSIPVVYDWDGDGKKDLIVGLRDDSFSGCKRGFVRFFKNIGTDDTPSFNGSVLIQACNNTCTLNVQQDG